MVLDQHEHYLRPLRTGLDTLLAPIQYCVDLPIKTFSLLSTNLASRNTLINDNVALHSEQLLLKAKLQRLIALESENKELRALLKSALQVKNERMVIAQLLSVSMNPLVSELIVDKGSQTGIYEGQPVLDANGVMGQVIQTGPWTSRVLLISDLRSAVPVQDTRNGVRGLIVGHGSLNKLGLMNIPETVDIRAGDLLVTSGLGGHYPEGYPVGTVSYVRHNSGTQFTKIDVIPAAQLDRTRTVLLLWAPHNTATDLPKLAVKSSNKTAGKKDHE